MERERGETKREREGVREGGREGEAQPGECERDGVAVTDCGIAGGREAGLQGTVQVVLSETRASEYLKD